MKLFRKKREERRKIQKLPVFQVHFLRSLL